jgi:hypothetical protein
MARDRRNNSSSSSVTPENRAENQSAELFNTLLDGVRDLRRRPTSTSGEFSLARRHNGSEPAAILGCNLTLLAKSRWDSKCRLLAPG